MWLTILIIIGALLLIKIYNKLTTGRCYCRNVMRGQVVIVTGANSGIGYETAFDLARRGAKVILACRDERKGQRAMNSIIKATKNTSVRYQHLDLSSLASVRRFVEDFKQTEAKLDVLVNNAGVSCLESKKTEDGIIEEMQVNYFGPFLLTVLLVPMLKKSAPSKVVNVSSVLHKYGTIDKINEEGHYGYLQTYANSKLCVTLFSNELARRLEDAGVEVNSLHPGQVNTSLYRNSKVLEKLRQLILYVFFKSPKEGAQTSIYLAVSNEWDQVTGKYFVDCAEAKMSTQAQDRILATKLWSMSEELVKLKQEERV